MCSIINSNRIYYRTYDKINIRCTRYYRSRIIGTFYDNYSVIIIKNRERLIVSLYFFIFANRIFVFI